MYVQSWQLTEYGHHPSTKNLKYYMEYITSFKLALSVGQFAGMQQSSNNNSCAGGQGVVQAPQPQQPVQAGGKNKKKGQAQSADAARKVNDKPDQQLSAGG
jgi:hypothetical protein